MYDLMLEIQSKMKTLDIALKELAKSGKDYAEAERQYRAALAQKILTERDKGTAVTVISDICRGSKAIADLKFKRDVAEVMYKTAQEALNVYKLQLRVLENQVEREWGKND